MSPPAQELPQSQGSPSTGVCVVAVPARETRSERSGGSETPAQPPCPAARCKRGPTPGSVTVLVLASPHQLSSGRPACVASSQALQSSEFRGSTSVSPLLFLRPRGLPVTRPSSFLHPSHRVRTHRHSYVLGQPRRHQIPTVRGPRGRGTPAISMEQRGLTFLDGWCHRPGRTVRTGIGRVASQGLADLGTWW